MTHKLCMARALVLGLLAFAGGAGPSSAQGKDQPVAIVNGRAISEADVRHLEAEIGSELASMPEASRRQAVVEFLVHNELLATAAEAEKLGEGPAFEQRLSFYRRRALRDAFYESRIKSAVTEADARKYYDQQSAAVKDNPQVRARHILVEKEQEARELRDKLKAGADFAELARTHSKDPGSGSNGGDLGFLRRGQTVKAFDEMLFKLKPGELSEPVKSEFGWHLIKVEEHRTLPPFEGLKDRIIANLVQEKAQAMAEELRTKAKIEYLDPVLRKAIEGSGPIGIKPVQ